MEMEKELTPICSTFRTCLRTSFGKRGHAGWKLEDKKTQVDWQETQKPKFLAAIYKEHHVHLHHQHLHQDSNKSEEDVRSSRENRDQR